MINYFYCVFTILCFICGFIMGQRVKEGKKAVDVKAVAEVPEKIVETVQEKKKRKKDEKEQEKQLKRIQDVIDNINAYDGTSKGQKEIKK